MKEFFRDAKLNSENLSKLIIIDNILEDYMREGYRLTLRQVYYQLVSKNIIPNNEKEYKKLSKLLKEGRMSERIDWSAVEDRGRQPHLLYSVDNIAHALEDTVDQYRLDRQKGQDVYIEVWVEKDALSNIMRRITDKYHIRLMVNKGYSSCSAMYDAAKRIKRSYSPAIIFYLGDHDPSGIDMVRDIENRFREFGLDANVTDEIPELEDQVSINRIALTMDQIKEYDPPPNPTKITDPRADNYIALYGKTCWELDALPPQTLIKIAKKAIEGVIDIDLFKSVCRQEENDIIKLRQFVDDNYSEED